MSNDKIKQIKELYDQLDSKMEFVIRVSQKLGLNFFSVKNHHFGGKWNIPEKYQDAYLKELKQELKQVLK